MQVDEAAARTKLRGLSGSQQSIETLSLYFGFYKSNAPQVAQIWLEELQGASAKKKLFFLWLANDVLQQQRKSPEYGQAFQAVLSRAIEHFIQACPDKKDKAHRMIGVWIERSLFAPAFTSKLQKLLGGRPTSRATAAAPAKKLKKQPTPVDDAALVDEFMKTASAIDESQRQDAQVAGQVAALPTELFDVDEMFKITDIATGAKLQLQADSACTLLAQRQGRLVAEADDRQNLIRVVS